MFEIQTQTRCSVKLWTSWLKLLDGCLKSNLNREYLISQRLDVQDNKNRKKRKEYVQRKWEHPFDWRRYFATKAAKSELNNYNLLIGEVTYKWWTKAAWKMGPNCPPFSSGTSGLPTFASFGCFPRGYTAAESFEERVTMFWTKISFLSRTALRSQHRRHCEGHAVRTRIYCLQFEPLFSEETLDFPKLIFLKCILPAIFTTVRAIACNT